MTIRNLEFIEFDGEISVVRVQLDCDTIADLPKADGLPLAKDKTSRRIHQGSTALLIKEGNIVIFAGDNTWVDVDGNFVKEG